jgi:hypothetical protein
MDPQDHRTLLVCSAVCLLMGETLSLCGMLMQLIVLSQYHHSEMIQKVLELDLKIAECQLLERQEKKLKKKIQRRMRKRIRKKGKKMWGKYVNKLDRI